jgi:hypothetical protein
MTVWEIVIMMVVATVCIASGIGVVYNSIVNTVERYQIRKAKRELEIFTKVIGELPNLFKQLVNMVEEKEQERNKKFENEFANKIRELKQDE